MEPPPMAEDNPYIGTRSFKKGEKLYGRGYDLRELVNLLLVKRLVLLHSPSGAGKTSLIQAALIPEMTERRRFWLLRDDQGARVNFTIEERARLGALPPHNPFVLSTLFTFEEGLPQGQRLPVSALAGMTIDEYLRRREEMAGAGGKLLLIIDQFEEVLTHEPHNQAARRTFFEQLGLALQNRDRWALLVMREDYLGALEPYLSQLPTGLKERFHLDFLNKTGALEAMQAPAGERDVEFTAEAAQALFDDLSKVSVWQPDGSLVPQPGAYVEPVQLQAVCQNLWNTLRPDLGSRKIAPGDIGQADYVDLSLAEYYAAELRKIAAETGTPERELRNWVERYLITRQKVRSQVMMSVPLTPADVGIKNEAIWKLAKVYLVRPESRRGLTFFELSHDRLVAPVLNANRAWRAERAAAYNQRSREWDKAGRPESMLLIGPDLKEAESWAGELDDFLEVPARELLRSSQTARDQAQGQAGPSGLSEAERRTNLADLGWGVIFPAGGDPAVRSGLAPLLEHRFRQATARRPGYYKEFTYQPSAAGRPETAQQFLARHGAGAGPVDPEKVPYYLLIVGSPEEIPFEFQYGLDVQYAAGRLYFASPLEYARYAWSVLTVERDGCLPPKHAALVAPQLAGETGSTLLASSLVTPLANDLARDLPDWQLTTLLGQQASFDRMLDLLADENAAGLLFVAGHTQEEPGADWETMAAVQGAPLLPTEGGSPAALTAGQVPDEASLLGLIAFLYGPYTAGTPRQDGYGHRTPGGGASLASQAFLAQLPQRLLGHPNGGALAVFGHVDRSGIFAFPQESSLEEYTVFRETFERLMRGCTAGAAKEALDQRHTLLLYQLSERLNQVLQARPPESEALDPVMSNLLTASVDARNYLLLGDPAVRLPSGPPTRPRRLALPRFGIVTAGVPVNLRAGPGANYPTVTTALPGTILEVSGTDPEGAWLRCKLFTPRGESLAVWISADWIDVQGEGGPETVPVSGEPPGATPLQGQPWVITRGDSPGDTSAKGVQITPAEQQAGPAPVFADLEIGIYAAPAPATPEERYAVELRFNQPGRAAEARLARQPFPLDLERLQALESDPYAYAQALSQAVFGPSALKTGYFQAVASTQAAGLPLRIRLLVDPSATELNGVAWEALQDPQTGRPLVQTSGVIFLRYAWAAGWEAVRPRRLDVLRCLAVISGPRNLTSFTGLPRLDLYAEQERITQSLGGIPVSFLASDGGDPVMLEALARRLREERPEILFIVCHTVFDNTSPQAGPYLLFEQEDGTVARVSGQTLGVWLNELPAEARPRLVILAAPLAAGENIIMDRTRAALALRLLSAGVLAVLTVASRLDETLSTALLSRFFDELQRNAQVDYALEVARSLLERPEDQLRLILWSRVQSGRLWLLPGEEIPGALPSGVPELEVSLLTSALLGHSVQMRYSRPGGPAGISEPLAIDIAGLAQTGGDRQAIGSSLSAGLFGSPRAREFFEVALATAQAGGSPLRIRLALEAAATRLHELAWENLLVPGGQEFLVTRRDILFSRTIASAEPLPEPAPPGGSRRALIAVAAPPGLEQYGQARLDTAAEVEFARQALVNFAVDVLSPVTVAGLRSSLSQGYGVVYLVYAGGVTRRRGRSTSFLFVENEAGVATPLPVDDLAGLLADLPPEVRPPLVVLVSNDSATVAAHLSARGIPAMLGLQGKISFSALRRFMAVFFQELQFHGEVDRAVSTARQSGREPSETGVFVLYMRLKTGRLWETARPSLFMAPPLPPGFILRAALLETLQATLLDPAVTGRAVALVGMAGSGKSSLAAAACHAQAVRQFYPDGVLWATLGSRPEVSSILANLIAALAGERRTFNTPEQAAAALAVAIGSRRMLFVIDDVESPEFLDLFLHGGPSCTRLLVTRNRSLLPKGAPVVEIQAMDTAEALQVLATGLPRDAGEALLPLARRLENIPLSIAIANRLLQEYVQRGQTVSAAAEFLLADIAERGLAALDARRTQVGGPSLVQFLEARLAGLGPAEQARLEELAIFPAGRKIPLAAVNRLWWSTARLEAGPAAALLQEFWNQSLLAGLDLTSLWVDLHPLIAEFLAARLGERAPALHEQILTSYTIERWQQWPPEDAYIWDYAAYHLSRANRGWHLRSLLLDLNWLQARLEQGGPFALLADCACLPEDASLELLASALRLSAHILAGAPGQLPAQLLGRLINSAPGDPAIRALLLQAALQTHSPALLPLNSSLAQPGGPLRMTLAAHPGGVNAVVFAPNGRRIISGGQDGAICIWDLDSGALHSGLVDGDDDPITSLQVSADGRTLLATALSGALGVWDLPGELLLHTLSGPDSPVEQILAEAESGQWILRAQDGSLFVCDLSTANPALRRLENVPPATALALFPGQNRLALGTAAGQILVVDYKYGKELATWEGHERPVCALAISPNGRQIASAAQDGSLRITDQRTQDFQTEIAPAGHAGPPAAIAITPDGSLLVSAGSDRLLKVWNLARQEILTVQAGHTAALTALALAPDGSTLVSAGQDGDLLVWDLSQAVAASLTGGTTGAAAALAVTPDSRQVLSFSRSGYLKVWDAATWASEDLAVGQLIRTLTPPPGFDEQFAPPETRTAALLLIGSRQVLTVSADARLALWDLEKGQSQAVGAGAEAPRRMMKAAQRPEPRATPTGASLGDLYLDPGSNTFLVWETPGLLNEVSAEQVDALVDSPQPQTRHLAYTFSGAPPDQLSLALINRDLLTRRLLLSGRQYFFAGHKGPINAVAELPDGLHVSASDDGTLVVWNLNLHQAVQTLTGHTAPVNGVAAFSQGGLVASTSTDRTLRVWDARRGQELARYTADSPLVACTVAPDGVTVAAGDENGGVHILEFVPSPVGQPEAGPPVPEPFRPSYPYLWQNPTLRPALYPYRDEQLRDCLLTCAEADLVQANRSRSNAEETIRKELEKRQAQLRRLSHSELLAALLERFEREPDRYPPWQRSILIHFVGLRPGSAHGSWAPAARLVELLRDFVANKLGRPGQAGYLTAADRVDPNRSLEEQALDRLLVLRDRLEVPTWFWKEVVQRTDLRLSISGGDWLNDWENLTLDEVALKRAPEAAPWVELLGEWISANLSAWRDQHRLDFIPRVVRGLSSELVDHAYQLRGLGVVPGLAGRARWLAQTAAGASDPPTLLSSLGSFAPQDSFADQAFFRRPSSEADLKPGASLLHLGWTNRQPNTWQAARPLPGIDLLAGAEPGWQYQEADGMIFRTAAPPPSTAQNRMAKRAPTLPSLTREWLRWTQEGIVLEVVRLLDGPTALVFASPSAGLQRIPLSGLLGRWEWFCGYHPAAPLGTDEMARLEESLTRRRLFARPAAARRQRSGPAAGALLQAVAAQSAAQAIARRLEQLTPAQRQALALITAGSTPAEAAASLQTGPDRLEQLLQEARSILGVSTEAELRDLLANWDFGDPDRPQQSPTTGPEEKRYAR